MEYPDHINNRDYHALFPGGLGGVGYVVVIMFLCRKGNVRPKWRW